MVAHVVKFVLKFSGPLFGVWRSEFPEAFCLTSHTPPQVTENAPWHTLQFSMYLFSPTQKPAIFSFTLFVIFFANSCV